MAEIVQLTFTLDVGSSTPIIVGNATTGNVRPGPTTGTVR